MESIVPAGTDKQDEACQRCVNHDPRDRIDHGHVPTDFGRVHNHGPTDARGLECPERHDASTGRLRGVCLGAEADTSSPALEIAPTPKSPLDVVKGLLAPQWRTNRGYEFDTTSEAYAAGRNDLIDDLREEIDAAELVAQMVSEVDVILRSRTGCPTCKRPGGAA